MTQAKPPVVVLSERVTALEQQRVTYRQATVLAVDTLASTFDADVAGAGRLNGISSPPHFLPTVGDVVQLSLSGSLPTYQPGRVAEGAIGDDELAEPVKEQITVALDTATGKNKVFFSTDPATASSPGSTVGDLWFQRDLYGLGVIVAAWEWTGTDWSPRQFHDSVLNSLTVGKLVSGTGVFDMLMAGSLYSATSGTRYRIDAAGIRLYSGSNPVPSIDLNAITGVGTLRSVVLENALIRTQGSGQRLQIDSGGTAGGRTLTFYPAGAGQPATVYSRDDGAGNAGVTMEAGGANHGLVNFTSTFADIAYRKGGGNASFIRVADDPVYGVSVGVEAGKAMLINAPEGLDLYGGASRFARISRQYGLQGIGMFSLDPGSATAFTFGTIYGGSNADIYALRFISTNPGSTGGFVYFSDRRLKRNVQTATFDALAEVLATPVRTFEWIETGETGFGFVAQEVPADVQVHLSPDEPVDGVTNPIGVASEQMLAKVVRAVQQLNDKVEVLRARVPK